MQQEFLQYAKQSLTKENIPYSLIYEPRKGDGRVLSQGLKLEGLSPDLRSKGYYLTLQPDDNGQRELCQPPYHSKKYGAIPLSFDWIEEHAPKTIRKEVDIVDFMEIKRGNRTYELFTTEEDIQEQDRIRYVFEEQQQFIAVITSVNRLVYEDQLKEEFLLIASITVCL